MIVILSACDGPNSKPGIPVPILDAKLVTDLPVFAKQINEVEIADSMNELDPTFVLGSIVNIETGQVRGLDNYLSKNAKPIVTPQTQIVFKDLIENSVAANASWLDFIRAQLNDKVRAELSVVKTSKVTIKNEDLDKQKLTSELRKISREDRANYGVIIGYVSFILSATLFKDFGTDIGASGYGAKIGGSWFTKFENTSAHHRVIAIWSTLPFVVDLVTKPPTVLHFDLDTATDKAIKEGNLDIKPIGKSVELKPYIDKKSDQRR